MDTNFIEQNYSAVGDVKDVHHCAAVTSLGVTGAEAREWKCQGLLYVWASAQLN